MLTARRTPEHMATALDRDLTEARQKAVLEVARHIESVLSRFTDPYPHQETLSWGTKLEAARRVISTGSVEPVIRSEAAARGVSDLDLARRVVTKGQAYEMLVAVAAAARDRAQDAIRVASVPEDVVAAVTAFREELKQRIPQ